MLRIYNSLTNKIEDFKPINDGIVNMYVCGMTVWNYIHIGNARPVVFFDMVKRYLEFLGYKVKYAQNITDVDDKIIKQAISENVSEKEIALKYEKQFLSDLVGLNSSIPDVMPHATDYIDQMAEFVNNLVLKGYAYEKDGDYFFRVNKVDDYGILSNQSTEDLLDGVRIEVNDKKENNVDFSLWKNTDVGIKYKSVLGEGRPGWHTECVVMNNEIFSGEIDIHGGGMDLKFPHHENEIAQAKALYNHHVSKYFMHVGRVNLEGQKMSKSLGNGVFVKDYVTFENKMALRMLLLFSPYRQNISYNQTLFDFYVNEYQKIKRVYKQSILQIMLKGNINKEVEDEKIEVFKKHMNNDFSTPNVLTLINDITKELNVYIRSNNIDGIFKLFNTLQTILDTLGIKIEYNELTDYLKDIYFKWEEARKNKDFINADIYRNILVDNNIL